MAKTKTKSADPTPYNLWGCITCKQTEGVSHQAMMEHLKTVHNIDTKTAKGSRRLIMHSDAARFYTYKYEWEIGGVKLANELLELRDAESRAYWGD